MRNVNLLEALFVTKDKIDSVLSKVYSKIQPRFPFVRHLKTFYLKYLKIRRKEPRRYRYLFEIIRHKRCGKIMEIGTWDGNHALQMIREAQKNFPPEEIAYYGFDLFELLDDKTAIEEFAKISQTLETVRKKLEETKANVHLYKGFTQETLPKVIDELPKMDFVFIDGGHSIETIENDWKYVRKVMDGETVVIFDDYWNRYDAGCKKVIENIDRTKFEVKILPVQDRFKKEWGVLRINFVQVKRIGEKHG